MRVKAFLFVPPTLVWMVFAGSVYAAPVTVTGCLKTMKHERGEFRLTQATGGDVSEYELIPSKGVDLKSHVGHKVEVTG